MTARLSTVLTLAGVLAIGWSCGNPSGQGSGCQSTGANVIITAQDNLTFDRPSVNLAAGGQRVCWQNRGQISHTVTATSAFPADSSWTPTVFDNTLNPGGVVIFTFSRTGTYTYHCAFHAGMTGTINVP